MSASKTQPGVAQTGGYSVQVKNGAGWRKYDTCRLQISVGQPYHEGAKFAATVQWVAERFSHVILCVNDTLQRYNSLFLNNGLAEESLALWRHEGDEWLNRNGRLFKSLPDHEICRWDDWLTDPAYRARREDVDAFYAGNTDFQQAVKENIESFWQRNQKRPMAFSEDLHADFLTYSKEYVLEETAVFALMFERTEAVDIYPGSVLLPAVIFREHPVPGMPMGLDKGAFTRIDFRKNQPADAVLQTSLKRI